MGIDPARIKKLLDLALFASDTDAKGRAYEALAVYLFGSIPGCITQANITSFFRTEQIDLGVGNDKHVDGLTILPNVILVECKDWSRPVDSSTLGYFINTLANRVVEVGVLIAANGITGNSEDLTFAHSLGMSAMARGIKVLVVTTAEISALNCTADFTELLKRRFLLAIASGGIGVPDS